MRSKHRRDKKLAAFLAEIPDCRSRSILDKPNRDKMIERYEHRRRDMDGHRLDRPGEKEPKKNPAPCPPILDQVRSEIVKEPSANFVLHRLGFLVGFDGERRRGKQTRG